MKFVVSRKVKGQETRIEVSHHHMALGIFNNMTEAICDGCRLGENYSNQEQACKKYHNGCDYIRYLSDLSAYADNGEIGIELNVIH